MLQMFPTITLQYPSYQTTNYHSMTASVMNNQIHYDASGNPTRWFSNRLSPWKIRNAYRWLIPCFVRTLDRQHVANKRNFEFYHRLEVKVPLLNFIKNFQMLETLEYLCQSVSAIAPVGFPWGENLTVLSSRQVVYGVRCIRLWCNPDVKRLFQTIIIQRIGQDDV